MIEAAAKRQHPAVRPRRCSTLRVVAATCRVRVVPRAIPAWQVHVVVRPLADAHPVIAYQSGIMADSSDGVVCINMPLLFQNDISECGPEPVLAKHLEKLRENRGRFASLPQLNVSVLLTAVRLCPALVGVAFECMICSCRHIRIAELPVCSSSGGKRVQFQNSFLTSMCVYRACLGKLNDRSSIQRTTLQI